ncbi:MAG: hypothetical protein WD929_09580 [Steroidobacteraceae bacterium]
MNQDLRDLDADAPTEEQLKLAHAAARLRSFGLCDAEKRKRAKLAAELKAELRRPLVSES